MPTTPPHGAPFDDLRAAFDRLATPDKAAFVLEATLGTIGQALTETGRQVADAISGLDLDSIFRDPMRPAGPGAYTPPDPAAADATAAAAAAAASGEAPKKRPGRSRRDPGVPPSPDGPSAT